MKSRLLERRDNEDKNVVIDCCCNIGVGDKINLMTSADINCASIGVKYDETDESTIEVKYGIPLVRSLTILFVDIKTTSELEFQI